MKKRHLAKDARYVRKYGHHYSVVTTYCKMELSDGVRRHLDPPRWVENPDIVTCKNCIKAYEKKESNV